MNAAKELIKLMVDKLNLGVYNKSQEQTGFD